MKPIEHDLSLVKPLIDGFLRDFQGFVALLEKDKLKLDHKQVETFSRSLIKVVEKIEKEQRIS